jgi:NTP pyrophosphatase (non-canonical NTP hydrolase)
VLAERHRQDIRWGEQNHPDEWWLAILTEEVGEVAMAILHDEFGSGNGGEDEHQVRREVVQIAAVALAWLECLARAALEEKKT